MITLIADLILIRLWDAKVIFFDYIGQFGLTFLMLSLSFIYRWLNRSEAIGATTMSVGLMVAFTTTMALLNYLFLPNHRTGLDQWLLNADASLGYSWADMVGWSVQHPLLNAVMRYAYLSSLGQVALLIILLGFSGRIYQLQNMILTLTLAATIAVLFWIFYPTASPSAFMILPEHVRALSHQVLDNNYGMEMIRLLQHGPDVISPNTMIGLIAFPSYHTVLALAAIWYTISLKWWFVPFLAVNIMVLLGTLAHGGHYLIDLAGGALVFIVCAWISERFLRAFDPQQNTDQSRFQSPATKNFHEPSGLIPIR